MFATTAPKVLAIGLDSADPDLLLEWSDDGALPNLAEFRREGCRGALETPEGLADDAVWASFSTCMSPARHGRYHFKATLPGSYDAPKFRDHHFRHPPFWRRLSDAGRRVAVLDVPKSPRASRINGVPTGACTAAMATLAACLASWLRTCSRSSARIAPTASAAAKISAATRP